MQIRHASEICERLYSYRPFHGLGIAFTFAPGVPQRFTPGFMLSAAPQAKAGMLIFSD